MKKEIAYNFLFTIFLSGIVFIQNKYFIKYLGIDNFGVIKLFSQLFQYLNLVELGMGSAATFALYKPLAEKNEEKISIIISTIEEIYNRIALIVFFLGILMSVILKFLIKSPNFSSHTYIYWIIYLINSIMTYFFIKYVILFTANQEYFFVRKVQCISKIFYQLLQIYCVIRYKSIYVFLILLVLDNLTQYFILKKHFKMRYDYIFRTNKRYKKLGKDLKNLFWHKIGGVFVFNTDLILISKIISIEMVGIYSNYLLIYQTVAMVSGILSNILKPKIGKYIAINSKEKSYILFKKLNILFLMLAIFLSFTTSILINSFIKLWVGEDFILPKLTVILMSINVFVQVFRNVEGIFKEGNGFFDDIHLPILESMINLIFSVILGVKIGINGIILGTILSNVSVILIYKPILVFKRCFDKNIKEYFKIYGKYILYVIFSIIILNKIYILFLDFDLTWIGWITYSLKISIVFLITIISIFLLDIDFRKCVKKIINPILRRKNE